MGVSLDERHTGGVTKQAEPDRQPLLTWAVQTRACHQPFWLFLGDYDTLMLAP